ncbi:MAG: ABC transporter ATP-binding protein [bacterium]
MKQEPPICMHGVSFSYDADPVLEHVDICIEERSFISIIGPNGGGKTTLLKLMLGLLRPTAGKVSIFGKSPRESRKEIGYMPQNAQFDPHFPIAVMDVVLMGRLGSESCRGGRYCADDRKVADRVLGEVELSALKHRSFSSLSGGQRQRVLLARALACEPKILMLDEPTANLDQAVGTRLFDLLKKLNERLTIVLVSHDVGFVTRYVDRVLCVNRSALEHSACDLTGEMVSQMYGDDMHAVWHGAHKLGGHYE